MRYSIIDLQCEDIMWFGIDSNKCILAFTSGGCGSVPEFVCRSKEETNLLEMFFLDNLEKLSHEKMEIPDDGTPLSTDARLLAKKGIFVYDVSFEEDHPDEYTRIASPTVPIHIDDLPVDQRLEQIQHEDDVGEDGQKRHGITLLQYSSWNFVAHKPGQLSQRESPFTTGEVWQVARGVGCKTKSRLHFQQSALGRGSSGQSA